MDPINNRTKLVIIAVTGSFIGVLLGTMLAHRLVPCSFYRAEKMPPRCEER